MLNQLARSTHSENFGVRGIDLCLIKSFSSLNKKEVNYSRKVKILRVSLEARTVKKLPAMQETWV